MEGGIRGIVIVFSAFMIQVLVFGNYACVGIYTVHLLDEFNNDAVGVSLISSIHFAMLFGCGPLASFLLTKMSYRKLALAGAALVSVGIFCSPLIPLLPALYLFFGGFAGLGGCIIYLPSHILSGLYFEKYRALSIGIATAGQGMGAIVMPLVVAVLIEEYNWRGSMFILASLDLHLFIFAMFLIPPPTVLDRFKISVFQVGESSDDLGKSKNISTVDHVTEPSNDKTIVPTTYVKIDPSSARSCISTDETKQSFQADKDTTRSLVIDAKQSQAHLGWRADLKRQVMLFANFRYIFYFISTVIWGLTTTLFVTFAPELIVMKGYSAKDSAFIFAFYGVGQVIGCVFISIVANFMSKRLTLYITTNILTGILICTMPAAYSFLELAVVLILQGIAFGGILGLILIVLIDIVGVKDMEIGRGYLMLASGIGCLAGPPIGGALGNMYGEYKTPFYMSGILQLFAGIIMIFTIKPRCRKSKSNPEPEDV